MTKISNQYSLTNILTADLANSRLGINNVSPTVALDVTGAGRFSSSVNVQNFLTVSGATTLVAPTSGKSIEMVYRLDGANDYAFIQAYDRTASVLKRLDLNASMTILPSGNVGIGTSSPVEKLEVVRTTGAGVYIKIQDTVGSNYVGTESGNLVFLNGSASEKMRITSGGYTKISNNGTYLNLSGTFHELRNSSNDWNTYITSTTSSSPNGVVIAYPNATPNTNSNHFLYCQDTFLRMNVMSNGGIQNYSANNTNLSDIRTKKDIVPLGSYWDKFKAIEIVKFKYKDQTHDDYNIGVISQQVELVAPEFVDIDGFGTTPEDGIPLKSIYETDLYHATIKVLQEAMIKIEELSAKVSLLENK